MLNPVNSGDVAASLLCLLALLAAGCSSGPGPQPQDARLQFFGFVGVACGDDFSAEVAGFSNVATTCAPDPSLADLVSRQLDTFEARGLQALLNVEPIFFVEDSTASAAPYGGPPLVLRDDYIERWTSLVSAGGLVGHQNTIAAVFVADEPTWRGVDPAELAAAFALVKNALPNVSLMLVEAYPVLDQLVVPQAVDWVAFDRYGVGDPANDAEYLADLATLKAKRSRADQRVILIMDAQWLPLYGDWGFPPEAMASVADSYHRLAKRDTSVIGLVGYIWPGGLDDPNQLGARDLPANVRATYRQIGLDIIGQQGT